MSDTGKIKSTIIVAIIITMIIPVMLAQTAQAKPHRSIFSNIGDARDRGQSDGIAAFKAGEPDSPNCQGGFIYCAIYNDAFHTGWSKASDVAQ
ncbi:MAG: hypothetical protein WBQ25_02285 [Nitrososphaeraceae archaeon]